MVNHGLAAKPRFETEACGNSEIAHCFAPRLALKPRLGETWKRDSGIKFVFIVIPQASFLLNFEHLE